MKLDSQAISDVEANRTVAVVPEQTVVESEATSPIEEVSAPGKTKYSAARIENSHDKNGVYKRVGPVWEYDNENTYNIRPRCARYPTESHRDVGIPAIGSYF